MYFKQLTFNSKVFCTFKIKNHNLSIEITMSNPLIKITNIKRDFVLGNEIIYVLKGIDLEINKGDVALMGPSSESLP
jgi:hypothetical protein